MGCAAVRGSKKQPTDETAIVSDPPPVATNWATKKEGTPAAGSGTPANTLSPKSPQNQERNLLMPKRDDDEDKKSETSEIEIIYEGPAKKVASSPREEPPMNVAANGQEPPEEVEVDSRPNKVEKPPELSEAQKAEAAKMAERRKEFEKRQAGYNNPAPVEQPGPVFHKPMEATVPPRGISDVPASDMVMALTQGQTKNVSSQQDGSICGLPGGIWDPLDQVEEVTVPTKKKNSHDDIDSTGFDADDNALMEEILADFEDL